jgi:uncharacterized repeat protein (TIGR03843 family)
LINNADRKGSHILVDKEDHIWLIDHGICFHEQDKLRTVIWDFAGENLPMDLCSDLSRFAEMLAPALPLYDDLKVCLSPVEIQSLIERAKKLVAMGHFPNPNPSRRFQPWPPL